MSESIDQLRAIQTRLTARLATEEDPQGLIAKGLHHVGEAITCLEAELLSHETPSRVSSGGEQFEVVAVATDNVPRFKGIPEIDNVTVQEGQAILLVGQLDRKHNGIWIVRHEDWAWPLQPQLTERIGVLDGLLHQDTVWICSGEGEFVPIPVPRRGVQ